MKYLLNNPPAPRLSTKNNASSYGSYMYKYYSVQECIPVGCVPSAVVAVLEGGVCLGGCLPRRGVFTQGGGVYPGRGCLPREGVSAQRGGVSAQGAVHLPPVIRIANRCKNITFPQFRLLAVIILSIIITTHSWPRP